MRKYIKNALIIFLVICSFFCAKFLLNSNNIVFAEDINNTIIDNSIDGIADENLYTALIFDNYNKLHDNVSERVNDITVDLFKDYETLNLSNFNIESLLGLNLLNLSNLKQIYLSNNKLQVINEDVLNVLKNVEIIDLSYNQFDYLDLSNFNNAVSIDLSYNNLTEVNLSNVKENSKINLMGNKIENTSNVIIENDKTYSINLMYNKLEEIGTNLDLCQVDYYFQNTLSSELTTSSKIKILSGYSFNNFNIKVLNSNLEIIQTINANEEISLPVGRFYLKFYNENITLYNSEDIKTYAFKDINLIVKPQKVSVKYFVNDEEVEYGTFSSDVTLKFYAEENAKIFVSVNGKEFVEQQELTIKEEKTNFIIVKCVVNEVESQNYNIFVTIKKPFPIPISLLVFLCAVVFISILYALRLYANKPINFKKITENNDENN